jgi:hypothetical protein
MSDNPSRLEWLPNEMLLDTFQYFDAGDLFRAFYNLNSRFNALLQSIDYLCLTLSNDTNDYISFASYIHTLKLGDEVNINPYHFPNVCHLQLLVPSKKQLQQLETNSFHYLTHLSIDCEDILLSSLAPNLWQKILFNGFSHLISCDLYNSTSVFEVLRETQSSNLLCLKIGVINSDTFNTILSICPDLYVFQFTICYPWKPSVIRSSHTKLKRMIIQFGRSVAPGDDCNINDYLGFVPNLKELSVYRRVYNAFFGRYLDYNWFALYISRHLPLLHRFKFDLSIVHLDKSFIGIDKNILNYLQERFTHIHNNQYKSELSITQSALG